MKEVNLLRVFVTGASGQLGYDVGRELERRGMEYLVTTSKELDIVERQEVEMQLQNFRPDAVIHCAAYTKVDQAENEQDQCWMVNLDGSRNIAVACAKMGAKLLYVSTDYVFPGTGTQFYETTDCVKPQNVYGSSKLAGELVIQSLLEKFFIVRTSWVFGKNGSNFVNTMLQLSKSRDEVSVVSDQIGSPTYTVDLAGLLCDMVMTDRYGIYHATNEGICSWADFAQSIFQLSGKAVAVKRVTTADYPARAKRPHNSRLSKESLVQNGFQKLPCWEDALKRFLKGELS